MSPREIVALRDYLGPELKGRTISDAQLLVSLTDILEHTCLGDRLGELSDSSVLLSTSDQLTSGLVMIELDGVARRMLLCPPDLNPAHLQSLMQDAEIDAVVTDRPEQWDSADARLIVHAQAPAKFDAGDARQHPVEQQQVRHALLEADVGFVATGDHFHVVAFGLKVVAEQGAQRFLVFDNHDSWLH